MPEIDITRNVNRFVLKCAAGVAIMGAAVAGTAWYLAVGQHTTELYDARVTGSYLSVKSRTAGTVAKILVTDGQSVKAGEKVAEIKVKVTKEEIAELEKNVSVMEQNLRTLEQGVPVQKPVYVNGSGDSEKLAQMQHLYEVGAISAAELERAQSAYGGGRGEVVIETTYEPADEAALSQARRRLEQAKSVLAQANGQRGAAAVTTPIGGTALRLELQEGGDVRPGQPIIAVGDVERLVLVAPVTEEKAASLTPGMYASYKLGGKERSGVILSVEKAAEQTEKAKDGSEPIVQENFDPERNWRVTISLPREEGFWPRPGTTTTVKVSL
ncbi:MAG: HlyD family efflux transporter periplasmic adaptor subunit [Selenomonadaceae bacterium]|nr:HlyD family efflux transporter periplasmic adaptor subunit [Selenomonadaceae bacterium]